MIKQMFYILFSLFVFAACDKEEIITPEEEVQSTSINKILPLGASRVQGARPIFESYRYELWKDLVDGEWTFDFIGTEDDDASYPEYAGLTFDEDHEGRGGWTSGQILEGIDEWLTQTGAPDIVLFSSPGGNDALQGLPYADMVSNVNAIIDAIQSVNPNVTIIIEQLAPAHSGAMTPELTTYFTQMQEDVVSIAEDQSTTTSSVIVVDMATDFSDDLLADDVHYNEEGAIFIADRYYAILTTVLQSE